jgi:hypothetical protein
VHVEIFITFTHKQTIAFKQTIACTIFAGFRRFFTYGNYKQLFRLASGFQQHHFIRQGSFGQGGRNIQGNPDGLYHIPARYRFFP